MTPHKAIKFLNETKVGCKLLKDRQLMDVCDVAISAIEKQIPKKPIEKETDNLWNGMSTRTVSCPNCKKQIVNVWNKADYKPKFCHYCGQALDWSDEE